MTTISYPKATEVVSNERFSQSVTASTASATSSSQPWAVTRSAASTGWKGRQYRSVATVAATIANGHRLRVDISGADFPLYDRNPNTTEGIFSAKNAIATERVHHKPGALSRIVLPCKKP